jgi:autoinducer 2-degrading protein
MQPEIGACGKHLRPVLPAVNLRMLYLSVNLTIKPENVEAFLAHAVQNAADSRAEPGCRQFDVLVDPKDRTRVMLFEIYNDEAAFEAHQQTAHFKSYLADGVPLLAARERHFWRRLSPP